MGNLQIIRFLAVILAVLLGKENALQQGSDISNIKLVTTKGTTHSSSKTYPLVKTNSELSLTSPIPDSRSVSENFVAMDNIQIEQQSSVTSFIPGAFPSPTLHSERHSFLFDIETPIKTIQSFCLTQSCKKSERYMSEFNNECCMNCECSDRCYAAGTCCVDKMNDTKHHNNTSHSLTEESCVSTFVAGRDYKSQNSSYLLFQKCTNTVDYQTQKKCLHPDVLQLDEMMPVYSRVTNRHYRNVFCSKCYNDAQNIVIWQTRMSCNSSGLSSSGFPIMSSTFSISIFISTNPSCALLWEPPSNVNKSDRCIPEQNIVSDCNEPILGTLCNQYYAPVMGGSIIYRNVFCMECANPSNLTGIYKECSPPEDFRFTERSLTAILSLSIDEKFDTSESKTCPTPRRYNGNLESCIHQTCAVTNINVSGVCRPVFSKLMNIHLEYRLKLIFRVFTQETYFALPFIQFDENIMDIVGITATLDNLCFSEFLDVKYSSPIAEISAIYIIYVESTNIEQSYKKYAKGIADYNEKAKENKDMFLLQIDNAGVVPVPEDFVTFVQFTRSNLAHNCFNPFAMTKLQLCDTITFHVGEFSIHDDWSVSIDNLMFRPGQFVLRKSFNGSIENVQVCLDDYISIHATINRKFKMNSAVAYGRKYRSEILFLIFAVISLN